MELAVVLAALGVLSYLINRRLNIHHKIMFEVQGIIKEHFKTIVQLHDITMAQAQRIKDLETQVSQLSGPDVAICKEKTL